MSAKKRPQLESITWIDAICYFSETEPGKSPLATIETVGWVIWESQDRLEIAAERLSESWRGVTSVPKGWVKKRRKLTSA